MERKYRIVKRVAQILILVMLFEVIAPATAWALTSGPTQPEVQQFEQVGTSGMVNLETIATDPNADLAALVPKPP